MSLPAAPGRADLGVAAALGVLASVACAAYALDPDARRRLRASLGQVGWGVAWFLAATIPLVEVYPAWSAQRCVFASVGLGVALAGLLAPAHPALVAGLLVLRLVTFQASPSEPRSLAEVGERADQEFDFRHLVRLQRLVAETRVTLARRFPTLPRASIVGQHYVPHMVLHAFEGDAALQVWYRDGSLHWMGFDEFRDHPDRELAGFVEHQPHGARQVAFVEADAMRELLAALALMRASRWADAMAALERGEDQQPDTAAAVFLGTIAAKRAVCLSALGRTVDAARAARLAIELWPEILDSRVTLAALDLEAGRYAEAETLLVDQLRLYPADAGALDLLRHVRATWVARTR